MDLLHVATVLLLLLDTRDDYLGMCSSRKYPYSPYGRFFGLHPIPPGNSSLASYFASKILTFKTPLPLGISDDLPWGGYGFFLELHNITVAQHSNFCPSTHQAMI